LQPLLQQAPHWRFSLLAFEATPIDCQTGVTSAGIEGFVCLSGS
jgi:hypothetical protein